ncbi:MAG: hypothetical protein DDT42_02010 [candidate division WS2 bacterium]|uniref:Uncharacterized protein n=1 Tax=Psychracetigena formicireducens TaxID=2986056 RepID=A0A9E2F7Z8_PSYF1|nr:hypothetical protein [Candidatus Psychracetigena formicireducens]
MELLILLLFVSGLIALFFKPIRKATGAVLIVAGIIFSLTFIGMIIGLPLIFFGVLLLVI